MLVSVSLNWCCRSRSWNFSRISVQAPTSWVSFWFLWMHLRIRSERVIFFEFRFRFFHPVLLFFQTLIEKPLMDIFVANLIFSLLPCKRYWSSVQLWFKSELTLLSRIQSQFMIYLYLLRLCVKSWNSSLKLLCSLCQKISCFLSLWVRTLLYFLNWLVLDSVTLWSAQVIEDPGFYIAIFLALCLASISIVIPYFNFLLDFSKRWLLLNNIVLLFVQEFINLSKWVLFISILNTFSDFRLIESRSGFLFVICVRWNIAVKSYCVFLEHLGKLIDCLER